jgi:uncharacterized protein involved in exopolysaccharide biosynthesis
MNTKDSLIGVLQTLFKWKKQILLVCLIAGLGAIVISLLLSNYYMATTTFLVVSPDQAKPEVLYGNGQLKTEYYGNENDIDRIQTIASSNELINFMIDSFRLYEHYDVNPELPKSAFRVRQKFNGLYEVTKTKRDAIELSIEDKDKELAANMANAARNKIDEIARALILKGQQKTITSYQDNIQTKESQLQVLSDTLSKLRKQYGIYDVEAQAEALTTQLSETESKLVRSRAKLGALKETPGIPRDTIRLLQANVKGLEEEFSNLNGKMEMFNEGMSLVGIIDRQYLEANQTLSEDKERLKQSLSTAQSDIPSILIVETAEVPIVKSRPKRSLIVIGVCAVAFLFSIIGVLLIEAYREINWKEVINGK